jgi:SMC interacting uncharacterized protein involved in chromosome segregation
MADNHEPEMLIQKIEHIGKTLYNELENEKSTNKELIGKIQDIATLAAQQKEEIEILKKSIYEKDKYISYLQQIIYLFQYLHSKLE